MIFTAFCLFQESYPRHNDEAKTGWFAVIFLFLYNKDKKEKDG